MSWLSRCFHRKSMLRLFRQQPADHGGPPARADAGHDSAEVGRRHRYGPQVVQLLETLWEASDHLGGKRLAAVLPTLMTALERHGHWQVDPDLRQKLLQISPATIDRLLAPARSAQGGQHRQVALGQEFESVAGQPGGLIRHRGSR